SPGNSPHASLPLLMLGELERARQLAAQQPWMLRIVAVAHWQRGEHEIAQSLFADPSIPHPDFTNTMVLLQAILWAELCHGDRMRMREHWQAWLPRLTHSNGQRVWHILAYALGGIDEKRYRDQPNRSEIEESWWLAQA